MNWGRIVLSAFIFMVISTLIHQVEALLTMKYYLMPEYFGVWSKIMMPNAGPPPTSFYLISLGFGLLTGLVLAVMFVWLKDVMPKKFWGRVWCFTATMFVLALVFSTLPMILMINLPNYLIASWACSSAVIFFLTGMVFAKLLKK